MDLLDILATRFSVGFPRTRGDGPWKKGKTMNQEKFPPHARGWTPGMGDNGPGGRVSPARAGMGPISSKKGRENTSFPRTRGDGPERVVSIFVLDGFPPHARGWTAAPSTSRNR